MSTEHPEFARTARALCEAGRKIAGRGACPATSGNFSARVSSEVVAITTSGKDKGALEPSDIMLVDLEGAPLSPGKPSAETGLHTHLYARHRELGAVLHTHAASATRLSRLVRANEIHLTGWELIKAFEGVTTHEDTVTVPVFDNTQDIAALARSVSAWLDAHAHAKTYGYLIRGHGIYVWGSSLAVCMRHLEAFDYLLALELEDLSLPASGARRAPDVVEV